MALCSVCLEAVDEGEGRSTATLSCGHAFHLDCIGSAFNAKGRMQCPNCRGIEQGQWLFANACCRKEDLAEDGLFDQEADVYRTAGVSELNYSRWCPHQGLYGHISLSHEEPMNHEYGYTDSGGVSLQRWHIHPYLVSARNIPQQSPNPGSPMPLRSYNHDNRWNHTATRGMSHARHARLALPANNGTWASFGWSFQPHEFTLHRSSQNGAMFQTNQSPLMFGLLLEGYESVYTRLERTVTISQPSQNLYDQADQRTLAHLHTRSSGVPSNSQLNDTRTRRDELIRTTARRPEDYNAHSFQITEPLIYDHWLRVPPFTHQQWNVVPNVPGVRWTHAAPTASFAVPAYLEERAPFAINHRNRATNPRRGERQFGGMLRVAS